MILIVEDDLTIVNLIRLHLTDHGYDSRVISQGDEDTVLVAAEECDLVILDIMLPGLDGLSICRRMRDRNILVPILMLTARSSELDKIVGLENGADDYLTKPFGVLELIARIRALLRRSTDRHEYVGPIEKIRTIGPLTIDFGRREAIIDGRTENLTAKEFKLLQVLAEKPGQAFSRSDLLEQVWGYQYEGYSHTVNSHINRLRAKLEKDPTHPQLIETVWGFGYRLFGGES